MFKRRGLGALKSFKGLLWEPPFKISWPRNQKPEVRKAQREQAVRAAKDAKKTTAKKPAASKDNKAQKAQMKATKNVKSAAPRVGGKR